MTLFKHDKGLDVPGSGSGDPMADSEETVLEEDTTETAGGGGAQVQEEQQGQAQQEAGAGEGGRRINEFDSGSISSVILCVSCILSNMNVLLPSLVHFIG